MSGAIWRVRRRRKAFSISEGPAAGRSIRRSPVAKRRSANRALADTPLFGLRRYGANQHPISKGPDGAMPPGQWRYLLVGEKFWAPRVFRHWIHAIAATKKTLHR